MKKHNLKEKIKTHRKMIGGALVIALCLGIVGAIGGVFPSPDAVKSNRDIPAHDGDVLVDSINVGEAAAPSAETKASQKAPEPVTSDKGVSDGNSDSDFEEMRATINMDRNQVISMLTDAATTAENSSEKENASQQKLKLLNYMQQEQNVENAIKAKGLPQCLVLITESGVNVTVNKQDLKQSDVAKICDIVMRQTGRKAPEIIIQSKF